MDLGEACTVSYSALFVVPGKRHRREAAPDIKGGSVAVQDMRGVYKFRY